MSKVIITGSKGLIGTALKDLLEYKGISIEDYDILDDLDGSNNILDQERLFDRMKDCVGVVHLAAVSRVIWGQKDPEKCMRVNVTGTHNVVSAAQKVGVKWMIYASSREVYGAAETLPVSEDVSLMPVNVYGQSKLDAENLVISARQSGLNTAICRFSNVYGSTDDHPDRVIPAFTYAAAHGETIRVEGQDNIFDFNHVTDTANGISLAVDALNLNEQLPPIHFVSGRGTSLKELASICVGMGRSHTKIEQHPPRKYDVDRFIGDPTRAESILGWKRTVSLEDGLKDMITRWNTEKHKRTA